MLETKTLLWTHREYTDGTISVASNARIGRYCFFPKQIEAHYSGNVPNPLTIVDIGCGGAADHPLLRGYFRKRGIEARVIGVDVNGALLHLARTGEVTYPLEVDLQLNEEGKMGFNPRMLSYRCRAGAVFPKNLGRYFRRWDEEREAEALHINEGINREAGRWVMKQKHRSDLTLVCADTTALPLPDGIADVVIAENFFLFDHTQGVGQRIKEEIERIRKPGGAYLGDLHEA